MSIGLLYERSETDEMGIRKTATDMGIELTYIPFRKVAVQIDNDGRSVRSKGKTYSKIVDDITVILNRAQSKNRRFIAATVFEAFDKHVINPSPVEFICYSKLRTLLRFWKKGISIPRTVFVPCNPHEPKKEGGQISNEEEIADLLQQELGIVDIVLKPDAGTHGREVRRAKNRQDLLKTIGETEPSTINPLGILGQEFINKWFYDLRIVVFREKGKLPHCYPNALARAGFKDFRTNTYLGNMVFGAELPADVRDLAIKCGSTIGGKSETWVIALDAMINVGKDTTADDEQVKAEFEKLESPFNAIKKIKVESTKKRDFLSWNKRLEEGFQNYKKQESYHYIKRIIEGSIWKNRRTILFHEANACPEFWEQTRLVAGINLAVPLLQCAQSIIESNGEKKP